ncbi:MAG: DUF805 domain-containing protein [Azovibrio sp.]
MEKALEDSPFKAPQANLEQSEAHEGPFKLNIFSPKGRLGRMRYFTFSYALMIVFGILAAIFGIFLATTIPSMGKASFSILTLVILLTITWMYLTIMLTIKRLHDMNASGWWILMPLGLLIAIVIISGIFASRNPGGSTAMLTLMTFVYPLSYLVIGAILTFVPGTKDKNRFGSAPSPNSIGVKIAFYIMLALAVFSIINIITSGYKYSQAMKAGSEFQQQRHESE